jgi:hypothetical protein
MYITWEMILIVPICCLAIGFMVGHMIGKP